MKSVIIGISVVFFLVSILSISNAFALKSDATPYGTISIDGDVFSILGDDSELLQISGNIEDPKSGVRVNIDVTYPDGTINKIETIPNNDGFYTTILFLDQNWQEGLYTINANYIENDFHQLDLLPTILHYFLSN